MKILLTLFVLLLSFPGHAQTVLLRNGGFEGGGANSLPNWTAYEGGYDVDRTVKHNGTLSLRLDNSNSVSQKGASQTVTLNQTEPTPIQLSGWSKAEGVTGVKNDDYALYVDLVYNDGTTLWGEVSAFRTGTHEWERRKFVIFPRNPVREMTVYVLLRRHAGTAWFDDVSVRELRENLFDSQALTFPMRKPEAVVKTVTGKDGLGLGFDGGGGISATLSGGERLPCPNTGGFFLRNAKGEGEILPLRGKFTSRGDGGIDLVSGAAGVRATLRLSPKGDALALDAELNDTTKTERALTLYFCLPVEAAGWNWGDDIRTSRKIGKSAEFTNQTRGTVGATGGVSLYPYGVVSNATHGVGIASQMEWASTYRIFYSGASKMLVIAWDVSLSGKTATWPPYNARCRASLFQLSPALAKWGFRAATARFYALNPNGYTRRAKDEGIWIPFTDPAKVPHVEDFGVAYHEGDNSVKSDDALNILSFRYTEPSSYWLPLPTNYPRTYEDVLKLLQRTATSPLPTNPNLSPDSDKPTPRSLALSVINSGIKDESGKYSIEFRKEPWNDGALILLNPNPELPSSEAQPTKASLSYNLADAVKRYGNTEKGTLDGEYLDSLESWGEVLDFRPEHLKTCPYPIPYETDTFTPCVPQWYNVHTFARFLRDDLRNRGKLLFANSTPVRFNAFSALCDVMGIEVNWLNGKGEYNPDPDHVMNLRRTLSAKKPYLLLMNTDFEKFGKESMERYLQTCLFYGIYPSCFSANAADNVYWENTKWIERDRDLFKKYIPQIKRLSAAGWEPVTKATSSNEQIGVERFGSGFLTLRNFSTTAQTTTLSLSLPGKTSPGSLTLSPGEVRLIEIKP
ncbi:MAG: hypothetical protein H7308_19125 [Chthonomonadaceae bacterium]|nr:hypothetical protein [Chthonomonadaceae bacterium]